MTFKKLLILPICMLLALSTLPALASEEQTPNKVLYQPLTWGATPSEVTQPAPNPLTQTRVQAVNNLILNGDIFSDPDVDTFDAYRDYMLTNLSQDSLDVMGVTQAEIGTLGILPHELDERFDELQTPSTDPRWDPFALESESLFLALPFDDTDVTTATGLHALPDRFLITLGAITIIGVIACDFKIQACATDVQDAYDDCVNGRLCKANEEVDVACCNSKAANDIKNCTITCGLNGPDGDYANCCRPKRVETLPREH